MHFIEVLFVIVRGSELSLKARRKLFGNVNKVVENCNVVCFTF